MGDASDKVAILAKIAGLRREIARLEQEADLDRGREFEEPTLDDARVLRAVQLVAEYSTDLISIHASNGDYLYASPNCEEFFGWSQKELLGRNAYEFFHPDDVDRIARDHADHDAEVQGRVQYRIVHSDGRYRWVETRSRAHQTSDGGQQIVALTTDIHDQVMAERFRIEADEAKVEAAKQSSFARLARATAHEINNPLAVAMVAAEEIDADRDHTALRRALTRIKNVVDELHMLVERGASSVKPLRLDEVLDYLCGLLAGDGDVRLETETCQITAEVGRLHQLLYLVLSTHLARQPQSDGSTRIECRVVDARIRLDVVGGREASDNRIQSDLLSALRGTDDLSGDTLELTQRLAAELDGTAHREETDQGLHTRIELPRVPVE